MGLRHMEMLNPYFLENSCGAGYPCTDEGFGIDTDIPAPGALSSFLSSGCVALQEPLHGDPLRGSRGCSGTLRGVLGRWNVGMLECWIIISPEMGTEFSPGNRQELINGISGDGLGAQIVIRIQMNPSPGAVPGTCPKAPGLG